MVAESWRLDSSAGAPRYRALLAFVIWLPKTHPSGGWQLSPSRRSSRRAYRWALSCRPEARTAPRQTANRCEDGRTPGRLVILDGSPLRSSVWMVSGCWRSDSHAGSAESADRDSNRRMPRISSRMRFGELWLPELRVSAMRADRCGRRVLGQMRRRYGPPAHVKM